MKLTIEDLEIIRNDDETSYRILAKRFNVNANTIYAIKNQNYMEQKVVFFGNLNEVKQVVIEEYIKVYKKEPDEVIAMRLSELHQFYIRPEGIIIQTMNLNLKDKEIFRKIIKYDLCAWHNMHDDDGNLILDFNN